MKRQAVVSWILLSWVLLATAMPRPLPTATLKSSALKDGSVEIVWPRPTDLQSMGGSMVGQPSQVAQETQPKQKQQQTGSGSPANIKPQAKASVAAAWNKFIDRAIRLSAEQNGGVAKTSRGCQPELKMCWDDVTFLGNDGTKMSAKVMKDMNDTIVQKEVCSFNKTQDIRRCLDWDTEAVHRDMLDSKGKWHQIANE